MENVECCWFRQISLKIAIDYRIAYFEYFHTDFLIDSTVSSVLCMNMKNTCVRSFPNKTIEQDNCWFALEKVDKFGDQLYISRLNWIL